MRDARILLTSGSDDLATILTCGGSGCICRCIDGERGEGVLRLGWGEWEDYRRSELKLGCSNK